MRIGALALLIGSLWAPGAEAQDGNPPPEVFERAQDAPDLGLFRECEVCPAMVAIPAGGFMMGSPEHEAMRDGDETQRPVTLRRFAIGRAEITFAQWDACVRARGCGRYRPADRGWGRGESPVIGVSWRDAQAYVAWLNQKLGVIAYRLPSEAEWEYAARAGTSTAFWTGPRITVDQANFNGGYAYRGAPKGVFRQRTVPTGSLPANPWGLREVHGNVWEWVQDCWSAGYDGAPTDGSALLRAECERGVLRGGAWVEVPWSARSASRYPYPRDGREDYFGFRVAREM